MVEMNNQELDICASCRDGRVRRIAWCNLKDCPHRPDGIAMRDMNNDIIQYHSESSKNSDELVRAAQQVVWERYADSSWEEWWRVDVRFLALKKAIRKLEDLVGRTDKNPSHSDLSPEENIIDPTIVVESPPLVDQVSLAIIDYDYAKGIYRRLERELTDAKINSERKREELYTLCQQLLEKTLGSSYAARIVMLQLTRDNH